MMMTTMMTTTKTRMMTDSERVAAAQAEAQRRRDRLLESVQDLVDMLEPRRLVRELWEDAKIKGADLAEEAVDAVKSRPIAAGGIAAVLALYLAREPIAELAGKLVGASKEKKKARGRPRQKKPSSAARAAAKVSKEKAS